MPVPPAKIQRNILLADPHGFCTGVKRAIVLAEEAVAKSGGRIYCLNELVHNRLVVDRLAGSGMVFVKRISDVPDGETVLFSAHGVSPAIREEARNKGLNVIDATCVFVKKVHEAVKRYAADGCSVLLIGSRTHDEVLGVAGEAPESVTVLETVADAESVQVPDPEKVAVLTQTTLADYQVRPIIDVLCRRFPNIRIPDKSSICFATTVRQEAVRKIARDAEIVLVLGSRNSANSNRLVDVARSEGTCAELIPDIPALKAFAAEGHLDGVTEIGLTAGASTPEDVVDAAREFLEVIAKPRGRTGV